MKNGIFFMKSSIRRNLVALLLTVFTSFVICSITNISSKNFSSMTTKAMKVAVIDQDDSQISNDFIRYLREDLDIEVITGDNFDFFSNELIERRISVIIDIPIKFQNSGIMSQSIGAFEVTSLDDYANAAFINIYISSYLQSMDLLVKAANGSESEFTHLFINYQMEDIPIEIESAYMKDDERDKAIAGVLMSASFFCMFSFYIGLSMAFVIMEDRLSGVYERIKTTPVKVFDYVLGTAVFTIITSFIPIIIYIIYLKVMRIPEVIPYGVITVFLMLFALIAVSFCFMASFLCKTKTSLITLIIAFCSIGPILGGAYFPIQGVSDIIDRLSKLVPHYWYIQPLRDITENKVVDIRINIVILVLFIVLFTLIAGGKFVQKEKARI